MKVRRGILKGGRHKKRAGGQAEREQLILIALSYALAGRRCGWVVPEGL
jgi:hypothetical protein